jgi:hypothetical protein
LGFLAIFLSENISLKPLFHNLDKKIKQKLP